MVSLRVSRDTPTHNHPVYEVDLGVKVALYGVMALSVGLIVFHAHRLSKNNGEAAIPTVQPSRSIFRSNRGAVAPSAAPP